VVAAKDHGLRAGEHATEQWRRLAQILPAAFQDADVPPVDLSSIPPGCYLQVSEAQRSDLQVWLRARGLEAQPLILMQVGNKRTMRRGFKRLAANNKYWPYERWAAVLQMLNREHPDHAIVLLGTGPEYQLNQEIAALAGVDRVHNAADDLPVPRLIALLERGDGLITVDSGPAHAAAAVGCPQVTLFGKALTSLYRPWGSAGADVKVLCGEIEGQPSMLGIETQAVIDAWRGLKLRSS
jgi:ADP-heptose:LPS heptosyltransferase